MTSIVVVVSVCFNRQESLEYEITPLWFFSFYISYSLLSFHIPLFILSFPSILNLRPFPSTFTNHGSKFS